MNKQSSSRAKRHDWKKWAQRAATLGRTALQLYIGIKRREPVYIGLGIADAVQTLTEWENENTGFDIETEMRGKGLVPLYTQSQFMRFLHYTMKSMDVPSRRVKFSEKSKTGTEWHAVCYDVCGVPLWFVFNATWLEYVYGKDVDTAIAAFSRAVQERLGQWVTLTVATENWTSYMGLEPLEPHLEAYISPVDINDFCDTTLKFQQRGINRAHLLCGPPGTGKTTFASLVAKTMGLRLLVIEGAPLSKIMDSGIQLDKLVDIVQPRVILFDDLDRTARPDDLLGEIERLNRTRRSHNILMLGSVNSLDALPPALCREGRFDSIVEFKLPDAPLRTKILLAHLQEQGVRVSNGYVSNVIEWSAGLSGAALRELALQISVRGYDAAFIRADIEHRKRLQASRGNKEEAKQPTDEVRSSVVETT